jgi:hypothetical protein
LKAFLQSEAVCDILHYKLSQGPGMSATGFERDGGGLSVADFEISPLFFEGFGKISKKKQIRACQVGSETYFRPPA